MNIESIIAKFGYSNEISNYLRSIYPYLVSYLPQLETETDIDKLVEIVVEIIKNQIV